MKIWLISFGFGCVAPPPRSSVQVKVYSYARTEAEHGRTVGEADVRGGPAVVLGKVLRIAKVLIGFLPWKSTSSSRWWQLEYF